MLKTNGLLVTNGQYFGHIVLVLAWHMCGDNSVAKGPQTNQYFFLLWQYLVQNSSKTAIWTKTDGLLVTNGLDFWFYCPCVGLEHVWG